MGIVLELLAISLISAAVGCLAPIFYYRAKIKKTSTRWVFKVDGEFARSEDLLPGRTLDVHLQDADSFRLVCVKPDWFEFRLPKRTVIKDPQAVRIVEL
jgi:hypothetical protein